MRFQEIIELGLEKSRTALLGSDCLYDILDLDSKNTRTTLMASDWYYDVLKLDFKYSDYLTGFGLILCYIGLGLEKQLK